MVIIKSCSTKRLSIQLPASSQLIRYIRVPPVSGILDLLQKSLNETKTQGNTNVFLAFFPLKEISHRLAKISSRSEVNAEISLMSRKKN